MEEKLKLLEGTIEFELALYLSRKGIFEKVRAKEIDILDAIENFQSKEFIKFEDENNVELMWQAHINKDNRIEVEIMEL